MEPHEQRVRDLIAAGKKIEAIRELREATRMGLAEAKAAVERLELTGALHAQPASPQTDVPVEVADLARRGRPLEAIKALRERRGLSLADAKQIVDRLPVDPEARRSGCLGGLLFAVAVGGALLGSA